MNVLVACEESQAVCIAFRSRGHRAFSCDIQECSGGHPEWHIQGDVLPLINGNCSFVTADSHTHTQVGPWDLLIAHPPCTFMTAAGAVRMFPEKGHIDNARLEKALEAKDFFLQFYNAACKRICIENPRPLTIVGLPAESQVIQPYEFGEPWSKATFLWLKGLPLLKATKYVFPHRPYVSTNTSKNKGMKNNGFTRKGGASRSRSKSFLGICNAMADQWGTDKPKLGQLNLFDDMEEIYDS